MVGEHDLGDTEESETQTIPVAEILNHPHYYDNDINTERSDIAILTLASPITFSASAAPVCLPASWSWYEGEVATVTGWGAVDNLATWNTSGNWSHPNWGDYPDILQEVQLTVVSNNECDDAIGADDFDYVDR